jgi:hypothetical protein
VLSQLTAIRSLVFEFYVTEGRYPESFNDLGLNKRLYDTGKLIKRIQFSTRGEFRVDLGSDTFGEGKYMIYRYKSDANAVDLIWSCFNNLDRNLVSLHCEEMT